MPNSNNKKAFQFDLNKTVYFEKGHEISEMRKISLDPDILIHPQGEYVHIEGLILLQGEYKKVQSIDRIDDELNEATFQTNHFVNKIIELRDGFAKFNHRFPVDITIPAYRVDDLNNVSVVIQSFDYELPSSNMLKVISNIEINGISTEPREEGTEDAKPTHVEVPFSSREIESSEVEEQSQVEVPFSSREEESVDTDESTRIEVPFSSREEERESLIDVSSQRESEPPVGNKEFVQPKKQQDPSLRSLARSSATSEPNASENELNRFIDDNHVVQGESDEQKDDVTEPMDPIAEEIPQDQEIERLEAEIMEENEIETIVAQERSELESVEVEEVRTTAESSIDSEQEIDIQLKESEEDEEEDKVRDVHFLTTIFNGSEEESYSKLRIYIVQEDDTVQSIAKRYEVSSLKLLQLNDVSGEDLAAGELLYIPETSSEN